MLKTKFHHIFVDTESTVFIEICWLLNCTDVLDFTARNRVISEFKKNLQSCKLQFFYMPLLLLSVVQLSIIVSLTLSKDRFSDGWWLLNFSAKAADLLQLI